MNLACCDFWGTSLDHKFLVGGPKSIYVARAAGAKQDVITITFTRMIMVMIMVMIVIYLKQHIIISKVVQLNINLLWEYPFK